MSKDGAPVPRPDIGAIGGGALVVFLKTGSEANLASSLPISLACE